MLSSSANFHTESDRFDTKIDRFDTKSDELCTESDMMDFVQTMMRLILKVMNFVLKMMDFVQKMMRLILEMTTFLTFHATNHGLYAKIAWLTSTRSSIGVIHIAAHPNRVLRKNRPFPALNRIVLKYEIRSFSINSSFFKHSIHHSSMILSVNLTICSTFHRF